MSGMEQAANLAWSQALDFSKYYQALDHARKMGQATDVIISLRSQMQEMEAAIKKVLETNQKLRDNCEILEQDRDNLYIQREALKQAVRETVLAPGLIEKERLNDVYDKKCGEIRSELNKRKSK